MSCRVIAEIHLSCFCTGQPWDQGFQRLRRVPSLRQIPAGEDEPRDTMEPEVVQAGGPTMSVFARIVRKGYWMEVCFAEVMLF